MRSSETVHPKWKPWVLAETIIYNTYNQLSLSLSLFRELLTAEKARWGSLNPESSLLLPLVPGLRSWDLRSPPLPSPSHRTPPCCASDRRPMWTYLRARLSWARRSCPWPISGPCALPAPPYRGPLPPSFPSLSFSLFLSTAALLPSIHHCQFIFIIGSSALSVGTR